MFPFRIVREDALYIYLVMSLLMKHSAIFWPKQPDLPYTTPTPKNREGITLKSLLGHQYFAPLRPESIESDLPAAWKRFMDQGK